MASQFPTIIHIGYIKTATTFLQEVVLSGSCGDIELAAGDLTRALLVENIILADDYDFDPSKTRSRLEDFASKVRLRESVPVWSEEMLLGNPPSPRYDGYSNARKLHAVYPDAKILITIRRQESIALSMYREYVLGGGRSNIKSFIGTGDEKLSFSPLLRPEFLYYDRAIYHYIDLFGKENVLVLAQEMISEDIGEFENRLSEFCSTEIHINANLGKIHVSDGAITTELRRRLNRLIVRNPSRPGNYGFKLFCDRLLRISNRTAPRILDEKFDALHKNFISDRYQAIYRESNQNTANISGLELANYGYQI